MLFRSVFEKTAPLFNLAIKQVVYDEKGSFIKYAYLKAKYLGKIRSPAGFHTGPEKFKMMALGLLTIPQAIFKKLTTGINGSHIAVVFEKR